MTKYQVQVRKPVNQIVITCGHKHRTPEAAEMCRRKLCYTGLDPQSTCKTEWYHAAVMEVQGETHKK